MFLKKVSFWSRNLEHSQNMQKVVVGRWRQHTACVRHCSNLFHFLYFRQNLSKWSTAFEKLSLFIVHFQKRSKNGVKTLFCMIAINGRACIMDKTIINFHKYQVIIKKPLFASIYRQYRSIFSKGSIRFPARNLLYIW